MQGAVNSQGQGIRYLREALCVLIVPAFLIVLGYEAVNIVEKESAYTWLILISLLQLLPPCLFLITGWFNYMTFVPLMAFLGGSVGKFRELSANPALNLRGTLITALREQFFCTILILAAYYVCHTFLSARQRRTDKWETFDLPPKLILCAAFFSAGQTFILDFAPASLNSVLSVAAEFLSVLAFASRCSARPVLETVAKIIVLFGMFYVFLRQATLLPFVQFSMFILILGVTERKFTMLLAFLPAAVAVFFLQNVKSAYRAQQVYGSTDVERIGLITDLVSNSISKEEAEEALSLADDEGGKKVSEQILDAGFDRFGDDSLERVLEMTPSQVPFWEGETYYSLLLIAIPRVIWPDKPGRAFWNKFGHLYGYLSPDDNDTSVQMNFLAEGYMNFGYTGLYGVAIVMGILVALVERLSFALFNREDSAVYAFLLSPLMVYTLDLGTLVNVLALEFAVVLLMRRSLLSFSARDEYS